MNYRQLLRTAGCVTALLTTLHMSAAAAQTVEQFYSGKTIKMLVGAEAGAGYDILGRNFAKHYGKKIPGNPVIIVENMTGAGGLVAAANMQNVQQRDGTVIAALQRGNLLEPLLRGKDDLFNPTKVNWLGSLNRETNVVVAWHTSPIKTMDDLFSKQFVVGASGGGSDSMTYALLLNSVVGGKLKIVRGYAGGNSIDLAMERGEIEGRASVTWATLRSERAQWLKDGKINIVAQLGLKRNPDLPNVPNILEYVKDAQSQQVLELLLSQQEAGRPFAAPPGVPADRLAALRKAFIDTTNDPDFISEVKARGGSVELVTGEEIHSLLDKAYRATPEVLATARGILDAK